MCVDNEIYPDGKVLGEPICYVNQITKFDAGTAAICIAVRKKNAVRLWTASRLNHRLITRCFCNSPPRNRIKAMNGVSINETSNHHKELRPARFA